MAEKKQSAARNTQKKNAVIDPIYKKYTQSVIRSLASTEFYDFFMSMMSKAQNEFQFSNRKLVKTVDVLWVDEIEQNILPYMQNIITNPRNIIREEEIIVNVANAKKASSDVVRHLAQHGSLVEEFDEGRGSVRPGKLMQKIRDDSTDIYENRLAYTVLENAYHFVKIRHDALLGAMGEEFGAKLKMQSDLEGATESLHMDMFLHIREKDDPLTTDEKNGDIFGRISRLYRLLSVFMQSEFAQQLSKAPRVKGAIVKTNVLKKNTDYKAVVRLYEFLHSYGDVGYTIRIVEQNPEISETFQRDIFHNIMFNYIVLKGYLEDEQDRRVPAPVKEKSRTLKPKFIHQIIEEITDDYDLPDVEVRKVLIEELTKAQLMQEEAEERRRLVEERAKRKKEEADRLRAEKEAEKARIRAEKEKERERIRAEKEAEKARIAAENKQREYEERARAGIFKKELSRFETGLESILTKRDEAEKKAKQEAEKQKFVLEEAAMTLSEEEKRRKEEAERIKRREATEKARIAREKALEEKRRREEILKKQEAVRLEREEQLRTAAKEALSCHSSELDFFINGIDNRLKQREDYQKESDAAWQRHSEQVRIRRERRP